MAVGMLRVRRLFRQPEAQHRDDGGGGVGQIVHGIGGDGHSAGKCADDELYRKEDQIADNTDYAGKAAHLGADTGDIGFGIFGHEEFQKQFGHGVHSCQIFPHYTMPWPCRKGKLW